MKKTIRILVIGLSTTLLFPSPQLRANWFGDNEQAIKGGLFGSAFTLVACYVLHTMHKNHLMREVVNRKEAFALVREECRAVGILLQVLQERVDAMPYNDFLRHADRKIAEVRALLEKDFHVRHNELMDDIGHLKGEISNLAREMETRRHYLNQVEKFLESLRDNNGGSFIEGLIDLKKKVESSLAEFDEYCKRSKGLASDIAATMGAREAECAQLGVEIGELKQRVVKQRVDSEVAETEAIVAKRTLAQARQEFGVLQQEVRGLLQGLQEIIQYAQREKSDVEGRVQQIRFVLEQTRARLMQLGDAVAREENALVAPSESQAQNWGGDDLLMRGKNKLSTFLAPFSSGELKTAAQFRKAYLEFSRKNHPDKGGNAAVFQAVDGLYRALLKDDAFADGLSKRGVASPSLLQYIEACPDSVENLIN